MADHSRCARPCCGTPPDSTRSLADASTEQLLRELALTQVRLLSDLRSRSSTDGAEPKPPVIGTPEDVHHLLAPEMAPLLQEQLRVVLLDTRHQVVDVLTLYQGTVNHISVRMAELFRDAIMAGVPAIVFAHNHPSGQPAPSPEDIAVTEDAAKAGDLLGIEVLDHIIIGRGRFESLARRGVLRAGPSPAGSPLYLV